MAKRLISIEQMLADAKQSFLRFPLSIVCAFFAGTLMIILISRSEYPRNEELFRYVLTALLGIPVFLTVTLVSEVRQWNRTKWITANAIALAMLIVYLFTLPDKPTDQISIVYRYLMLSIAAHAMVAFLPYIQEEGVNGFWHFNKSLFLRFFTASLYSGVLTAGLMIALAACDYLLGFDVDEKNYAQVAIFIQLFFHPWFFFAGVPHNLAALKDETEYPKGLKVFAQFILMSLVMIYLVILYAYEIKIIMSWNWPKGLVSQLILWYSVVGILSLLLLWPLREREESRWVTRYTKWFFVTLVPLLVMLFLAILQRVGDYGITVNRHVVLALACGLAIVTLHFIFFRKRDIRVIPMTLCVVALVSAYGPLSASSISESSQMGRLKKYLSGAPEPVPEATADSADTPDDRNSYRYRRDEKSSILNYLVEWHGAAIFHGMVSDSVIQSVDSMYVYDKSREIAKALGFEFDRSVHNSNTYVYLNSKDCGLMGDSSFDYVAHFDLVQDRSQRQSSEPSKLPSFRNARGTFARNGDSCFAQLFDSTGLIQISWKPSSEAMQDSIQFDLTSSVFALRKKYERADEVPCDEMTFPLYGSTFSATLILERTSGTVTDSTLSLDALAGYMLVGKR